MSNRKKHGPPGPPRSERSYRNPGTIKMLSTSLMTVGELPYQRPVREADVDKLIRAWDLLVLGLLVVSFRNGRYYVIDGQHRIAAAKKMNGGEDVMLACIVYYDMTYEAEAALCYKLDKAQKHKTLPQAINVLLESKKDPECMEIRWLIQAAGFSWALNRRTGSAYEITVTSAIISAYRKLGGPAFTRMLTLAKSTWRGAPSSMSAAMISGMALFIKTYETELNNHSFIKRLSALAPEEIIQQAKDDHTTNRRALRVARVLLNEYNYMRGSRELPYRFNE